MWVPTTHAIAMCLYGHLQSIPAPYQHLHTRCILTYTCKRHHTIPGNEHNLLLVTYTMDGRIRDWDRY